MSLIKCKCGRFTQNGFLCTNCQKDVTLDTGYYEPDDTDEAEELDDLGFTFLDSLDGYDDED